VDCDFYGLIRWMGEEGFIFSLCGEAMAMILATTK
jgi:hypothetical protein